MNTDRISSPIRTFAAALHTMQNGSPVASRRLGNCSIPLAFALLMGFGISHAAAVPNAKDLTQGKWEMVPAKSKTCTSMPAQSRREIVDAGWGLISAHITGIDAAGKPLDSWYVWRYDGDKYPADIGRPANESITWKLVGPSRVEFTHWSKDDKITEELVRTVSEDGQEMTQTRRYVGRKDCTDILVFRRQ